MRRYVVESGFLQGDGWYEAERVEGSLRAGGSTVYYRKSVEFGFVKAAAKATQRNWMEMQGRR